MIELHGWLTVRDTYKAEFEEGSRTEAAVLEIRSLIESLEWFKPDMRAMNGDVFTEFSLYCNRKNPEVEEVFQFFEAVGRIAEGSYGLIYLYDDEDRNGRENRFQVFVLARGVVKEGEDSFLSPVIPVIEDADEIG